MTLTLAFALNLCISLVFAVAHFKDYRATTLHPCHQPPPSPAPYSLAQPVNRPKTHALRSLLSAGGYHDTPAPTVVVPLLGHLVPKKGFACSDLKGNSKSAASCAFGTPGFDSRLSNTFQPYPNTTFAVSYGDGEYLSGSAAFETVSVGGLPVTHQEIGLVSSAAWVGDGINSGLLGLAYPQLTSVSNKSNPGETATYYPVLSMAFQQKRIRRHFSIALNRGTASGMRSPKTDPHLGYLAFGGVAPVPVTSPPPPANVATSSNDTIIDTGTTLNLVPTDVARAYNKGWSTWRNGSYYVDCEAEAPPFSVTLGGKTFSIDPRDQVVYAGKDEKGKELCVSGTQDGGPQLASSVFILGDVFLHNVVVTFDIKDNRMTFTQRKKY
ncbi:acid protease [Favolaschia claudopus]|uniref:Acid protease n=1 Tax=Favolaschia claudopus TaxID=2862362 RepID=A0AAW0A6I0_9AGAR